MPAFPRQYATGSGADVYIPLVKYGLTDHATSSDWTPIAGDVKISIDGGSQANIGTLPVWTNGAWKFVFSNAELTGKDIVVKIVDSATKAVEDDQFNIETEGHAAAKHPGVNLTSVLATDLTESNAGDVANNITQFFDVNPQSGKTINDVGIGSLSGLIPLSTTVASINSQTEIVLTAGSDVDGSYVGQTIILEDVSNSNYPSFRFVIAYVGSTKTLTLSSAPEFTIGATDVVKVLSNVHPYAALVTARLDHLVEKPVTGTDVTDDSIIAQLASKSATADWDTFNNEDDSLEAVRDQGDAAWGFSGSQLAEVKVCDDYLGVHYTSSQNVYFALWDLSTGNVFDFNDNTLKALGSATTPYIAATERTSSGGTGHSQYSASPTWANVYNKIDAKRLTVLAYKRAGGSPVLTTDAHISHPALCEVQLGQIGYVELQVQIGACVTSTAGTTLHVQVWLERAGRKVAIGTLDPSATITVDWKEVLTPANTIALDEGDGTIVDHQFHLSIGSPSISDDRLQNVSVAVTVDGVTVSEDFSEVAIG